MLEGAGLLGTGTKCTIWCKSGYACISGAPCVWCEGMRDDLKDGNGASHAALEKG